MTRKPYKAKTLSGAQAYVRMLLKQREETHKLLDRFYRERILLAKLAAKEPQFTGLSTEWSEATRLRDEILARECRLKPDGSPL